MQNLWADTMRHQAVGFECRVAWRAAPVNRLQGTLTSIPTNIQADLHNTHRRSGCPSEMVRILERLRVIRNAIWGSERPGWHRHLGLIWNHCNSDKELTGAQLFNEQDLIKRKFKIQNLCYPNQGIIPLNLTLSPCRAIDFRLGNLKFSSNLKFSKDSQQIS